MNEVIKSIGGIRSLTANQKLVLIVVGIDYQPSTLSVDEIARRASTSKKTITTTIQQLCARGYLTKRARFDEDGGQLSNVYKLTEKVFKRETTTCVLRTVKL